MPIEIIDCGGAGSINRNDGESALCVCVESAAIRDTPSVAASAVCPWVLSETARVVDPAAVVTVTSSAE